MSFEEKGIFFWRFNEFVLGEVEMGSGGGEAGKWSHDFGRRGELGFGNMKGIIQFDSWPWNLEEKG